MTSVPVKDVGSLLNFTGNIKVPASGIRTGDTQSFGDVMSKASGGGKNAGGSEKAAPPKGTDRKDTKVEKSDSRRQNLKTKSSNGSADVSKATEAERQQAVDQAGRQLAEETAKELDVSVEEVETAMEQLGLSYASLLDAENLTKLVLTLSGEDSALALLTNEDLYGTVQNLLDSLNTLKTDLMEQLSLTPEELSDVVEAVKTQEMSEQGMTVQNPGLMETSKEEKEPARIIISVEQSTETVKLTTDEKGNVVQVEGTVSKEAEQEDGQGRRQGQSSEDGSSKGGFQTGNPLLDTLLQDRTPAAEASFEPTASFVTPESQDIMNQILDYMKIQLKPEMNHLEMQLHPENLGTLHIQITSRGNEVTAQFHVQSEAVRAAIEGQIVELKEALKEQGIKVEAVEVNVQSNAFESALWQGQGRDESAYEDSAKKSSSRRSINLNALDEDFEEEATEEDKLAAEMMRVNGGTVDYTA